MKTAAFEVADLSDPPGEVAAALESVRSLKNFVRKRKWFRLEFNAGTLGAPTGLKSSHSATHSPRRQAICPVSTSSGKHCFFQSDTESGGRADSIYGTVRD